MVVTKADGNLLLELAGVPALTQLYRVLEELSAKTNASRSAAVRRSASR